ncbi:putative nuclease HARBI1 [Diorhabda carinulata]|uniref:putative nuclease HARBI1 n=1 Tax=Diorhabda carinulata TaxID=1163345 RepID=UPI0025A13CD0|nr:putative nuclease HARBI1 [Diorhabda carinulata]
MAPSRKKRAAVTLVLFMVFKKRKEYDKVKRNRTIWVKQHLQERHRLGIEENLLKDLLTQDRKDFKNFMRMDYETFCMLHIKVFPYIKKQNTYLRSAISSELRLAITLRFLATGDSYRSLEYLTRVSASTISLFVPQVCEYVYEVLQPQYMKFPCTKGEWEKIAKEFENKWNFPYTIGAIDGKHIVIEAPPNAGSYYFNYKGTHSIVLFALADANYNFLYIDVGCNGRISDGGIFKNCTLNQALQEATLNLPPDKCLPNRIKPVPYVMLGDEAFALSKNLLKPFPRSRPLNAKQKVFNYRLCRARRVVENAFGILTSRFRIFRKPICLKVETIDKIVLTACVSHNFLKKQCQEVTLNYELEDIPTSMRGIAHRGSNNASEVAHSIRNEFAEYFYNEGQIDFQWKHI